MKQLLLFIAAFLLLCFCFSSCYYDSKEVLYPNFKCDTINVTYNKNIAVIMDSYCTGCHSGSNPQGSVSLTTYEEVKTQEPFIDAAIKHTGSKPMPPGGKIDDCSLSQWNIWTSTQMPE
jgi:hypothetical protein